MKAFDENGRTLVISSVHGMFEDDIQFDLTYANDLHTEVPDNTYNYVRDHFSASIYEAWFNNKVNHAEYLADQERDDEAAAVAAHGKLP